VKTVKDRTATLRTMKNMVKKGHFACFRPGFTMTELLIATVVLLLILGITGSMYKSASDAMEQTNASTELCQQAEILKRQLESDLSRLPHNAILVIWRREFSGLRETDPTGKVKWDGFNNIRADQLLFFSEGDFQLVSDPTIHANMARICYTHGITAVAGQSFGQTPNNDTPMNRWVWARQVEPYVPNYAGPDPFVVRDPDPPHNGISLGQDMRNCFLTLPTAYTSVDTYIQNNIPLLPIDGGGDSRILLQNCGSVRIRYLLPNDLIPREPDAPYSWVRTNDINSRPRALEFTVRLYDRNLTISSWDEELNSEHGGVTYTFTIPLPK